MRNQTIAVPDADEGRRSITVREEKDAGSAVEDAESAAEESAEDAAGERCDDCDVCEAFARLRVDGVIRSPTVALQLPKPAGGLTRRPRKSVLRPVARCGRWEGETDAGVAHNGVEERPQLNAVEVVVMDVWRRRPAAVDNSSGGTVTEAADPRWLKCCAEACAARWSG